MTITHAIPGRIRLRHSAPLSSQVLEELTQKLKNLIPAAMLQYTPQTGSILILFGEKAKNAEVLALLAKVQATGGVQIKQSESVGSRPPLLQWPPMSQIKRGMALSLLAALAFLALGREHAHGVMGGVFLTLLSRHLWVYRRQF